MRAMKIVLTLIVSVFALSSWAADKTTAYTDWGWPLPYQKVSDKSVKWLKDKGWWPLKLGTQPAFTGFFTWQEKGFAKQRGLEIEFVRLMTGPAINEAAASGNVHAGFQGNFPFITLIANKVPVKAIGIAQVNNLSATLVPPGSPINSLKDLKKISPTPAFGIVSGSSAEFYFQAAAEFNGLVVGKDVILTNMPPAEMATMPKGLTGVVQWDPWVTEQVEMRKNAKMIDTVFAYNFYHGAFWIRDEIIKNAPDVAQALADMYVESILWSRLHFDESIAVYTNDTSHRWFKKELMVPFFKLWVVNYKPTWMHVDPRFWAIEDSRIVDWLYKTGRLKEKLSVDDLAGYFVPDFMNRTFDKLGWAKPKIPTFLPKNWSGQVGKLPYPESYHVNNLKQPLPFPEKEDLVGKWYFNGKSFSP